MHAHGKVSVTLFQKRLHGRNDPDGGNSNPLRTPGVSPRGSQNFEAIKHGLQVVQRFTHAHVHDVGKIFEFGQRLYLVYNFACCKIALKALLTGHAKQTSHFTANLRRNTKRGSVLIRYVGSFYKFFGSRRVKVLFCAIR